MNRITEHPVTFRLSTSLMSKAQTKHGEPACWSWWLEHFEFEMDQLASRYGFDPDGDFCIEFMLYDPHDRERAARMMMKDMGAELT
jgi:hypothetical protein